MMIFHFFLFLLRTTRTCVGIKEEPKEDVDWFCRACMIRKHTSDIDGKKKKRKKKDKEKMRDH